MPPDPPAIKTPVQLTPAILEKFFSNQTEELGLKNKELDLKKQELDLKKQEDDHAFEYAKDALKAQTGDNSSKRDYYSKKRKHRYYFMTGISVLIVFVVCYALHLDKDQIALEIVKAIAFTGIGGAGGYYMGKSKNRSEKDDDESSIDPTDG